MIISSSNTLTLANEMLITMDRLLANSVDTDCQTVESKISILEVALYSLRKNKNTIDKQQSKSQNIPVPGKEVPKTSEFVPSYKKTGSWPNIGVGMSPPNGVTPSIGSGSYPAGTVWGVHEVVKFGEEWESETTDNNTCKCDCDSCYNEYHKNCTRTVECSKGSSPSSHGMPGCK